jgi:gas vesicle protein
MGKIFRFLAGFLAGMAFGALVALMWAPYTGPELKARIQERIRLTIEEGRRAAEARRHELLGQLAEARRVSRAADQ